ncbi:hypothetical protein GCM10020254_08960 [Streptomyces goshikiensis]
MAEFAQLGAGVVGVLDGEHQVQQRRVPDGEVHVGPAQPGQPRPGQPRPDRPGGLVGPVSPVGPTGRSRAQARVERGEAADREGVEEGLPVAEVPRGRRVAHTQVPGEAPQAQALRPRGGEDGLGSLQQGGPEIAVVVRPVGGQDGPLSRMLSLTTMLAMPTLIMSYAATSEVEQPTCR